MVTNIEIASSLLMTMVIHARQGNKEAYKEAKKELKKLKKKDNEVKLFLAKVLGGVK